MAVTSVLKKWLSGNSSNGDAWMNQTRTKALITGSVAVGALLTGAVLEKSRRTKFPSAGQLPPALDAEVGELELMEGKARFYKRPGSGTPIVLLHSINAAASSFEMKPFFEHFASQTSRPVYALDWFGFGRSERPPVHYRPGLFQRQLRRFLSEDVQEPSDVVALSLACEYAATIANAFPFLVRKLVCVSPTALGEDTEASLLQRSLIEVASGIGAFELFFARLTSEESIKGFYQRQVFAENANIPEELVRRAYLTSHVRGAHHAPRWFVEGALFMNEYARRAYAKLKAPSLFIIPEKAPGTVQRFDRLEEIVSANPDMIQVQRIQTGLLPQWEDPEAVNAMIESFLH